MAGQTTITRKLHGTKDPMRQYQGAVNKQMGRHFEDTIDEALAYYAQRGEAVVLKTPEPMRPTKDLGGGKFVAYYEKQAQPDYKGALKGGQAVVFEAKHTTTDRIEQTRVTQEQTALLDRYAEMGAECFVLVGFDMRDFFRVPWAVWCDMKARWVRKYATPSDLEPYRVLTGRMATIDTGRGKNISKVTITTIDNGNPVFETKTKSMLYNNTYAKIKGTIVFKASNIVS